MPETHDHSKDLNVKKVDKLSPTRVRLTLEFSGESVAKEEKQMTQRYANQAKIPGFRPGKAPISMVRERFKDQIRQEVLSHLLEAGLSEGLQKTSLMPVSRPKVQVEKFNEGKPFEFHAEFEVEPEIELKKYKKIALKKASLEVEDSEVEKTVDSLRERLSSLEPTDKKTADKGDFVVTEVTFSLKDGSKKEAPKSYTVEVGVEKLLPAIDKALCELKIGEERDVEETFPADYQDKSLAGKAAVYSVKLLEVKKKVLPEVNDAFASQIKEGATVLEIRKEIRESLKKGKEEDNQRNQRQDIVEQLIKNNPFEVPNSLIESQAGQLLQWMEKDLKKMGRSVQQLNKEEIEGVRKRAENMVRSSLLLKEVAIKEKIELDKSRLDAKIDGIASSMGRSVEETKTYLEGQKLLDRLSDEVLTDQVFEFLVSNSEIK